MLNRAGTGRRWLGIVLIVLLAIGFGTLGYVTVIGIPLIIPVPSDKIQKIDGAGYLFSESADLFGSNIRADSPDLGTMSEIVILENGQALGPGHAGFSRIIAAGSGAYTHRPRRVIFSASDNSDPRHNGRTYILQTRWRVPWQASLWLLAVAAGLGGFVRSRNRFGQGAGGADMEATAAALRRCRLLTAAGVTAAAGTYLVSDHLWGALVWLAIGCIAAFPLLALRQFLVASSSSRNARKPWEGLTNLTVSIVSIAVALAMTEAAFGWYSSGRAVVNIPQSDLVIQTGSVQVTLPAAKVAAMSRSHEANLFSEAWQYVALPPINGTGAYRWHGELHIHDERGFRRLNGPFPHKDPDRLRIVVLGDSLTYGVGIDAEYVYPTQIEKILRQTQSVEILNLGVPGAQTEDILLTAIWALDNLKPDLVVYGFYLNDFLPSGAGQYIRGFVWPIPEDFQVWLLRKTLAGPIIQAGYQQLAIRLGIVSDFYDEVSKDLHIFQPRMQEDVAMINQIVRMKGLPPVLGIVFDIVPEKQGRGHRLAEIAEAAMLDAGMNMVLSKSFYEQYDRRDFRVSNWEGHPNEEAHAIFATRIVDAILTSRLVPRR